MLPSKDFRRLCSQLDVFGFKSYEEFLSSALWKEFRNCLFKKRRPSYCSVCNETYNNLTLHHKTYKRLLDPQNVLWVCDNCHKKIHEEAEKNTVTSISNETSKLSVSKNDKKYKKRVGSLRIVPASGLPETLHHSLHAFGVISEIRHGGTPKDCLDDYYRRKLENKDTLMVRLLEKYFVKALEYLATFTTN